MNREDDPDRVYSSYLLSLLGKLRVTRGAVAVRDDSDASRFVVQYARGRGTQLMSDSFPVKMSTFGEGGIVPIDSIPEDLLPADLLSRLLSLGLCYMLPVSFDTTTFAITFLGDPFVGTGFPDWGEEYALAISAITAIAIEGVHARSSLHNTNRRLERRIHRLRSVFESSHSFATRRSESKGGHEHRSGIVHALGYTLMGEMAISRLALYLREGKNPFRPASNRFPVEFAQEDLHRIMEAEEGYLIEGEEWGTFLKAGVQGAIPLRSQGETEGILLVGKRLQYELDVEDLEYLGVLGGLAISAIEGVRLLEEEVESERMKEELRIAWEIQQQLFPPIPTIPGYTVAAGTLPAQEVGGDCYDMLSLPDGRFLMTIADVSGKGVPASLLMANVQAALRALAPLDLGLPELAARVNDLIHDNTAADRFITAFLMILDPLSGRVDYVNAGHNPPFYLHGSDRDRQVRGLVEGGLILGVMPTSFPYESGSLMLEPGESIVMYTDGVTEAMNRRREEYGEDRLIELLCRLPTPGPGGEEIYRRVVEDVQRFVDGANRSDDVTVICLERVQTALQ